MQVHPFRGRFGGNQKFGLVPKVVDQRRLQIHILGAGASFTARLRGLPLLVNLAGEGVIIDSVDHGHLAGIALVAEQVKEVLLRAPRFSEDHRLARRAQFCRLVQRTLQ